MTMRNLLFISLAAAATAGGCDTGEVIPLAKVEAPADAPKQSGETAPPKNTPTSPSQLIYK
ncbi:hypothetical protein [Paludisphaera sp.]|uniref:hypothetical protein n=1 Tax=Paludisphaera sp. TaxID=2017432 RepID=UPI00301D7AC7